MEKFKKMECHLHDEAHGAQKYAEKYIFYADSKPEWAKTYAEMAKQEAQHARYLHKMYQESIDEMRWVPEDAKKEWEHCVNKTMETIALVELMLTK